jgi:uncharacterized protein YbjT (DUF2867 family)
MKIVVIGGSGLIGTQLVKILRDERHEVLPASPSTGVNTLTGEGLSAAVAGAAVVVDVANSPSFDDEPVMHFFDTTTHNIIAAARAAGVGHYVALSVVGTDRLQASGYFRAKLVQENLIKASKIPYTIVRATQFFEFVGSIAAGGTAGDTVRLSHALMQPIFSGDVAAILAKIAAGKPLNATIDISGPDPIRMDDLVRQYLTARRDPRKVTIDPAAGYFGTPVDDESLVPTSPNPRRGPTRFGEWLTRAKS